MNRRFQVKVIPSTWLEANEYRLDCGPYVSGVIEAKDILRKHSPSSLREVTSAIFNGPRFSRVYVEDRKNGVPFLSSTDILHADISNLPLLSNIRIKSTPSLLLNAGWTLITCSGTIGRMAYSRSDMKGMAGSQDFIRIVPDEEKIRSGYLYSYLSSRFGVPIVVSGTYGSVITHIEPQHIEDLPVPRLGEVERQAHDLVEESARLLTKYQSSLNEATELYFDAVGLRDITSSEWHGWGADLGFSSIASVHSLRALNYNPRFVHLCETIKRAPWKPLRDLCERGTLKTGARFTRIESAPEYGNQLIGQKDIFWLRPEGRWIARGSMPDDVFVSAGTILIASQGSLGDSNLYCRAEYITGNSVQRAYSQHFMKVVGDEDIIERGALFAFLRSETAFRMLRSASTGSMQQDLHYELAPTLPIPFPSTDVRKRCHLLVEEAYADRERAVELEDEARLLVERAIEEGVDSG